MEIWYDKIQDQLVVITNISSTQCYIELLSNMGDCVLAVMSKTNVPYDEIEYIGALYE